MKDERSNLVPLLVGVLIGVVVIIAIFSIMNG